jgi:hypothetical protein
VRTPVLICLALIATLQICAAESCRIIHGRANFYGGNGQLRIWHIGTHHEYEPDKSSCDKVMKWLEAGVKDSDKSKWATPASTVYLFGDFLLCPTEPFKEGSVQQAIVKSVSRRRYAPIPMNAD